MCLERVGKGHPWGQTGQKNCPKIVPRSLAVLKQMDIGPCKFPERLEKGPENGPKRVENTCFDKGSETIWDAQTRGFGLF